MNILFKKFKSQQYIVLFLTFIYIISMISIPVSANTLDITPPVVTVPNIFLFARSNQDYLVSITAEDNVGIKDVLVKYYARGGQVKASMTKNATTGRYEYIVPSLHVSSFGPNFTLYFTATDVSGLSTEARTPEIFISDDPNISTVLPNNYNDNPTVYGATGTPKSTISPLQINSVHDAVVNDSEYPVVTVPIYFAPARPSDDYRISVTAEDNRGIQEVTIDYSIGYKRFHSLPMTKNLRDNRYEFIIPAAELLKTDSDLNFTITATNVAGLKTDTHGSTTVNITSAPCSFGTKYYPAAVFKHDENNYTNHYNENHPAPDDASTIKEVLTLESGTEQVVVTGQIAYFATEYANPIIQSTIDGTTYALYIKGSLADSARIGDHVKLTGTYYIQNGLPMLKEITSRELIGYDLPPTPEIMTIADLKKEGLNMIGRFIKIKDIQLGIFEAFGLTEVKDATGSINIYKAAPYTPLLDASGGLDLYAIVGCNNSTVQLFTGPQEANGYNVYSAITDNNPPLITLINNSFDILMGHDYRISASVTDNEGIQEVTIAYTIGGNTVSGKPMKKDIYDGNYGFRIPEQAFSDTTTNFTFTITATDINGLSTSKSVTISTDNNLKITASAPSQDSKIDSKSVPITVVFVNGGASPRVIYTLKNESGTIITNKQMSSKWNLASDYLHNLSAGNYTAIVTIVRAEDGQIASQEWHFTVTE